MTTDAFLEQQAGPLTRRLQRMVGSREVAEDLRQEALLRSWRQGPRDVEPERRAAWLWRTASNLALDELRRRGRRATFELDEEDGGAADADPAERLAVREALDRVSPGERLVLLMRFEGGLSHAEIASLAGTTEEAARKRVARARAAFAAAWHDGEDPADDRPVVALVSREENGDEAYIDWLTRAGARVRRLHPELAERELPTADALVLSGSFVDVHPAVYRERPRTPLQGESDLRRDVTDLRTVGLALRCDLPIVGICRGHQLINVALGGSLHQDLAADGVTRRTHRSGQHSLRTEEGSLARRTLGRAPVVSSEHHQAIARLGRGVRPTSLSPDGVVEAVEVEGRSLALGLQWHPEHPESGVAGRRVADLLVDAGRRRAA